MALKVVMDGMQTSAVQIKTKNQKNILNNQQGFTLVEILIGLTLLVVILTLIPISLTGTDREKIQEAMTKVDRAVRFATDEAILRNSVVRIRFDLEKDPNEYFIEFGSGANIVLPEAKDLSELSIKDRERELEKAQKLDGQFNVVSEFEESNETFPEGISLYALGTTYYPELMVEGMVSLYFYPTGERDSALLIFNSIEEMATLSISPFESATFDNYYPFSQTELDNVDDTLENKSKELFEKWQKE